MSSGIDQVDTLVGTVLAERYRLEETIGEGGLGRVYRARHLTLGNHVAVKVLLAEYQDRPVLRKRFEREATALAELNHPNIVRVTDFGAEDQLLYIVMELLEGDDLAALVGEPSLTPPRAVDIVRQVLRALDYAHRRKVVHRDVKPHNVFVRALDGSTDHVQVLDFGLARFVREASESGQPLTRVGTVLGTPAYMAPEQATGGEAGAPADVYAVGVMLFELLAGRRPFDEADTAELLRAHILADPPFLRTVAPQLEVAFELERLIRIAMEKAPADRYADAGAMLAALDALDANALRPRWRSGAPPEADPPRPEIATAHTVAATPDGVPRKAPAPGARSEAMGARSALETGMGAPRAPRDFPAGASVHGDRGASDSRSVLDPTGRDPTVRSKATGSSRPRGGLIFAVAVLGALGVLALGVGWVVISSGADAADGAADASGPAPVPGADRGGPGPTSPAPPGLDLPVLGPRDPFLDPLPTELDPLHAKVEAGRSLNRTELAQLRAFARAHPDDPRPLLIEAHLQVDRRSLSWAFPLYADAIELDPTVSDDPSMLPDMLEMVRSGSLHHEAVGFVVSVYGRRALPAVEAQLAERMRREESRRLEVLRDRLSAL